jgi:hypothetical protein
MPNTNEVKMKKDKDLLEAVIAELGKATGKKGNSATIVARNVITLIRNSILQELEQAHIDVKYVIDNWGSVEWVEASADPEEIWDACIEICSGKPSTGWWVGMLNELQEGE